MACPMKVEIESQIHPNFNGEVAEVWEYVISSYTF